MAETSEGHVVKSHHGERVDALHRAEHELAQLGSASNGLDTKVFDTEEKRHMAVKDPSLFPDGGLRAWSVVGAAFLQVFCTFGKPFSGTVLIVYRNCKCIWDISDISYSESVSGVFTDTGCMDWFSSDILFIFRWAFQWTV